MRLTQSETYGRPGVFAAIGRRWFLSVCCEAVLDWVIGSNFECCDNPPVPESK
jgi:hypothetical protein